MQGKQSMELQVVVNSATSLEMSASIGRQSFEVIRTSGGFYVRANASFWDAHVGARATVLADRWIHTRVSTGLSELENFAPGTLAHCLTDDHGTLSIAGQTTIEGRPAVILKDAGDRPGTQPGTLAVATSSPLVPLRITSTGRERPGGRIDVCNSGSTSSGRGYLTFNYFNQPQPISPPANAIELPGAHT